LKGYGGTKGTMGVVGGKPVNNLLYENRNDTGLLSFLKKNLKNFKIHYLPFKFKKLYWI